jgi:hypothetical protein
MARAAPPGGALPEPRVPGISREYVPRDMGEHAEDARGRRIHRPRSGGGTEEVDGDGGGGR